MDATVIPMEGSRADGVRSVLSGADRASGERQVRRRRTTPLLAGREGPPAEPLEGAEAPSAPQPAAPEPVDDVTPATEQVEPVAPVARVTAKKAPARKAPAKKASAKKAPAAKKPVAKKAPANKVPAKKAPAKNVPAAKVPAAKESAPVVPEIAPEPVVQPAPADLPPTGGTHSLAWAVAGQIGQTVTDVFTEAVGDLVSKVVAGVVPPVELQRKLFEALTFAARRFEGDYDVDEFGFDPEFTEKVWLALFMPLYESWFRVEVRGIEHVPRTGGALIVANHSGSVPVDAIMTSIAVHSEHPDGRFLRPLAADLVFQLPFISHIARQGGGTLAATSDAERLLQRGELVGVWPEGFKGIGKPFSERYKLQRFGRGGFVSAALRTRTPIVPCSIVGAEEIYPIVADVPSLARLLGVPYLPITPFFPLLGPLGMIPLPSKWLIEFGPPLPTHEYPAGAEDDPMLVFDLTDQVRQSIQQTLYSLLVQRRSIFF